MGRFFQTIIFAIFLVFVTGEVFAQCAREGEELCQKGQTYRCEKTGSELTPIFQNVPCVVNATGLNGIWTGSGHQSPAGAAGADWAIAMTIGDGAASIDYPSLGCGGSLTQMPGTRVRRNTGKTSPTVRISASTVAASPSGFSRETCPGPGSGRPTASPTTPLPC